LFPPSKRDRRSRIKRLEYVLKNRDSKSASQVAAEFMLSEGISSRKLREYIRVLSIAKKIDVGDVKDIEEKIKII
jgi:hypothetical protein